MEERYGKSLGLESRLYQAAPNAPLGNGHLTMADPEGNEFSLHWVTRS